MFMYPGKVLPAIALFTAHAHFYQVKQARKNASAAAKCNAQAQSYFSGFRGFTLKESAFPNVTYVNAEAVTYFAGRFVLRMVFGMAVNSGRGNVDPQLWRVGHFMDHIA